MLKEKDWRQLMTKIAKLKKEEGWDLSLEEDLSLAVMNLISLEEHFFFSGAKTGKKSYWRLLQQVRGLRKEFLAQLLKKTEGEVWCISKHLLAAAMRLLEVGTKYQSREEEEKAARFFRASYQLYSLFWGLNLGLLQKEELKKEEKEENLDLQARLERLVTELVDCCQE